MSELAPFSEQLQGKISSASPVDLALRLPQLALAATSQSALFTRQAVIMAQSAKKCRRWVHALAGWQSVLGLPGQWHLIAGELTPQEQDGHVVTELSFGLHYLLGGTAKHHFVIPESFLDTLVPTVADYQQLCLEVHTGEARSHRALVNELVARGYTRFEKTIEPGGVRTRGEQLDVYHPTFPGRYTITLYGNTIESIVSYRDRRSNTVMSLVIPPMKFPRGAVKLQDTLKQHVVYQPHHLPLPGVPVVRYDALTADIPFPFTPYDATQAAAASPRSLVLYENWERIKRHTDAHPQPNQIFCRTPLATHAVAMHSDKVTIVSEEALLPTPVTTRPISYQQGVALLANLQEGRAAVHVDHGIGMYEGLQTRTIGTVTRDYLILRYTAGDTLSVPVEFAHKVTAYLGESVPKLSTLGGSSWATTRRRAKHDAEEFAKTLLSTAQARAGKVREAYYLDSAIETTLTETFPYDLTPDQETAWESVRQDLQHGQPMDRLIVGDVGFGKTEIAIRTAAHLANCGIQVAILAPTTLLVQQHADTFLERLPQWREQIAVLSRFKDRLHHKKELERIATGKARIVIGTHALLGKSVTWKSLGCVIIDEEQRFGVTHKEHFKKIRASVDVLSLSATPIPRTLSMALSGLKELSIISTPPEGRKSVTTQVGQYTDQLVRRAIEQELARGGQTYIVTPKIRGLSALHHHLQQLLPQARIAVAHGQLPNKQLSAVMQQFDTGAIDVLLCSTIVENGLDVPNANTLIVLQATHFGLSELYQLRGRIGRRQRQGYAYFLYSQQELTTVQRQRLAALTEASRLGSGWTLAQRDLEIRGAGNLLGAQQSGTVNAIGVQLYLDLIHQAIDSGSPTLTYREVEIHLPISAILPTTYIADVATRTHYYQLLSRAPSLEQLASERRVIEHTFGPFPEEATNLYRLMALQHAAAPAGITRISWQPITPVDEDPYQRLIIDGKNLPDLLGRLGSLGNWVVREAALTLDLVEINAAFAHQLLTALQKR